MISATTLRALRQRAENLGFPAVNQAGAVPFSGADSWAAIELRSLVPADVEAITRELEELEMKKAEADAIAARQLEPEDQHDYEGDRTRAEIGQRAIEEEFRRRDVPSLLQRVLEKLTDIESALVKR